MDDGQRHRHQYRDPLVDLAGGVRGSSEDEGGGEGGDEGTVRVVAMLVMVTMCACV